MLQEDPCDSEENLHSHYVSEKFLFLVSKNWAVPRGCLNRSGFPSTLSGPVAKQSPPDRDSGHRVQWVLVASTLGRPDEDVVSEDRRSRQSLSD